MDAKVDIRKLQLLNDRICQTIEALNQVRLSVHGIAHSVGGVGAVPGINPMIGTLPGVNPTLGLVPNVGFGLGTTPVTMTPQQLPVFPQTFGLGGLSHTDVDVFGRPVDSFGVLNTVNPLLAARLAGLFPYAFSPINPITGMGLY